VSEVTFGNAWHGRLTENGLHLEDDTLVTEIECSDASGTPRSCPYAAPTQNMGMTYYYKTPGIGASNTPAALLAIGGKFFDDAIIFGTERRYSAFSRLAVHGPMEWLHFGRDDTWCRISAEVVGDVAETTIVRFYRQGRVGAMNEDFVGTRDFIGEIALAGRPCASPYLSELDVRRDGRQVVLCLMGTWPNSTDPLGWEIFDNAGHPAVAAAWRIDVSEARDAVSAERVFLAEDTAGEQSFDRTACAASGMVFAESGGGFLWTYWESAAGIRQMAFDSEARLKRMLGAGFDAAGTLHLVIFDYFFSRIGAWVEVSGDISRGFSVGSAPLSPLPNPVPNPNDPTLIDLIDSRRESYVAVNHDQVFESDISIKANGVVLKEFSWPVAPAPYGGPLTNNVCELRNADASLCRVGPGAIDDTIFSGSVSPFAAFDHRSGKVFSSGTPVGFV
jgi:hypothetical protein